MPHGRTNVVLKYERQSDLDTHARDAGLLGSSLYFRFFLQIVSMPLLRL